MKDSTEVSSRRKLVEQNQFRVIQPKFHHGQIYTHFKRILPRFCKSDSIANGLDILKFYLRFHNTRRAYRVKKLKVKRHVR